MELHKLLLIAILFLTVSHRATAQQTFSTFLLYTDNRRDNIYLMDLMGTREVALPINGFENPIACDYDPTKQVFFALERNINVQRSTKAVVLTDVRANALNSRRLPGRSIPNGIAVDYISKLIYFTDRGEHVIEVLSYDFQSKTTILRNTEGLGEIVLDFHEGKMFYITYEDRGTGRTKIYSANGDGSSVRPVIEESRGSFLGLAIDTNAKMIYWTHTTMFKIERCSYTGRSRQTLIEEVAERTIFRAVTVDDTFMYYSVYNDTYLHRATKNGQQKQNFGPRIVNASFITDLHVYKPNLRQGGTNLCSDRNGGCGQMCLPRPGGRTCACDVKFTLDPDGRTCSPSNFDKHLVITDKQRHGIFFIDVTTNATFRVDIFNINQPAGLAWDWTGMEFYWVDVGYKRLAKGCVNRKGCVEVVNIWEESHVFEDIDIDSNMRQIYLIDSRSGRIIQTDLTVTRNKTIVDVRNEDPRALALDLTRRLLFWTSIGRSPRIERASMDDGSGRVVVVDTGLISPNDVVLDPDRTLMYWCDGGRRVVEVASMTGVNRTVLFDKSYVYLTLTLDREYLYVYGVNVGIFRIDRWTGANQQAVGSDSFLEVFDMIYIDTFQPPPNKVNPPLDKTGSGNRPTSTTVPVPTNAPGVNPASPGGGEAPQDQKQSEGGLDKKTIMYIGIGAGLAVLLIIIIVAIVVFLALAKKKRNRTNTDTMELPLTPQQPPQSPTTTIPQTSHPAPPAQNPAPYPARAPAPQPSLNSQLLAHQLMHQNEQQRQQQAQMLMMQQQMVLLQAQVQQQQQAPKKEAPQSRGFNKPPLPLPSKKDEEPSSYANVR